VASSWATRSSCLDGSGTTSPLDVARRLVAAGHRVHQVSRYALVGANLEMRWEMAGAPLYAELLRGDFILHPRSVLLGLEPASPTSRRMRHRSGRRRSHTRHRLMSGNVPIAHCRTSSPRRADRPVIGDANSPRRLEIAFVEARQSVHALTKRLDSVAGPLRLGRERDLTCPHSRPPTARPSTTCWRATASALDLHDFEDMREVFTPDAVITYSGPRVSTGIDEIITFFRVATSTVDATQHLLHTSRIWSDGPGCRTRPHSRDRTPHRPRRTTARARLGHLHGHRHVHRRFLPHPRRLAHHPPAPSASSPRPATPPSCAPPQADFLSIFPLSAIKNVILADSAPIALSLDVTPSPVNYSCRLSVRTDHRRLAKTVSRYAEGGNCPARSSRREWLPIRPTASGGRTARLS